MRISLEDIDTSEFDGSPLDEMSHDDIIEIENEVQSGHVVLSEMTTATERLCNMYEALERVEDILKKGGTIATESIDAINGLAAQEGEDFELLQGEEISLEAIQFRKEGIFGQIMANLGASFKRYFDQVQYNFTAFTLQHSRLAKLQRELKEIKDNVTVQVSTHNTKYMRFGENAQIVPDAREYVKQLGIVGDVMSGVAKAAGRLAEDDLLTTFTMLKKFATFKPGEYITDRFKSLHDTLEASIKSAHLKLENNKPMYKEYASPVMLGMSQFVIRQVDPKAWDKEDVRSMYDATRYMYMYTHRVEKVMFSTIVAGNSKMNVSKKDAEAILKSCSALLDGVKALSTTTASLSTQFASGQMGSFFSNAYRLLGDDYDLSAFTRSGRLLNRISGMLYDTVAPTFNYSLGNVKKGLSIVEGYIDQAS